MPADHKVSVAWQIVFTFLPIVNFWAFYRVRKLRKYLLYVILPSIAISIAYFSYLFDNLAVPGDTTPFYAPSPTYEVFIVDPLTYVLGRVAAWVLPGFAMQGVAIYLVIIWSRGHNRRFDEQSAKSQRYLGVAVENRVGDRLLI